MISFYNFKLMTEFCVFCVPYCVFSVKVKFFVLLLCVYVCILPLEAVPKMTYVGWDVKPYKLTPPILFHRTQIFFILLGPPLFLLVTHARLLFVNREQSMAASGLYDGPRFTPAVTVVWWPSCTL